MQYRILGRTALRISAIALGAGPVSGLMTGADDAAQVAVLRRVIEHGINWIDTAPGYGWGQSEISIGKALQSIRPGSTVHLATKVRVIPTDFADLDAAIRRSVEGSLRRLGVSSITLLQLHNGLTAKRDDEPFAITPADVLRPVGVLRSFQKLREEGVVRFLGLTGTGQPAAMREVVASGGFDAMQVPYHLLNPSAGEIVPESFAETNYGNIIADCARQQMGVLAIRVFAGGALLDQEPSAHTLTTPFFPLALFQRDRQRAIELRKRLDLPLKEAALRFVLSNPHIHSAIIGFGAPSQADEAVGLASENDRVTFREDGALGSDRATAV